MTYPQKKTSTKHVIQCSRDLFTEKHQGRQQQATSIQVYLSSQTSSTRVAISNSNEINCSV